MREDDLERFGLENVNIIDYFSITTQMVERNQPYIDMDGDLLSSAQDHAESVIVINCLSTMSLQLGSACTCRFLEKLNQIHKAPVFCINRRDLAQSIPRIESLGNIYVKLRKTEKTATNKSTRIYEATIVLKKSGGSVLRWNELVEHNVLYDICIAEKMSDITVTSQPEAPKPNDTTPKPKTSFRIEMSEQEMKQRDSVPLPYIFPGNPGGESKIIYVPDEADDLDEEDPDDDLDI